jgi:hypothetical protein
MLWSLKGLEARSRATMESDDRIRRMRAEVADLERRLADLEPPDDPVVQRLQAVLRNRLRVQREALKSLAKGHPSPLAALRARLADHRRKP